MDRSTAIALVKTQCSSTTYPALSDAEVAALVDATAGHTTWQASTSYDYGVVVAPTVPNGHLYKCIVAGTSASSEPAWPTYTAADMRPGVTRPHWHGFMAPWPASEVGDGSTLMWIENGPDTGTYSVREATYNAWLQKAAKASADYDGTVDKDVFTRSQVFDHCMAMAEKFRPMGLV